MKVVRLQLQTQIQHVNGASNALFLFRIEIRIKKTNLRVKPAIKIRIMSLNKICWLYKKKSVIMASMIRRKTSIRQ